MGRFKFRYVEHVNVLPIFHNKLLRSDKNLKLYLQNKKKVLAHWIISQDSCFGVVWMYYRVGAKL